MPRATEISAVAAAASAIAMIGVAYYVHRRLSAADSASSSSRRRPRTAQGLREAGPRARGSDVVETYRDRFAQTESGGCEHKRIYVVTGSTSGLGRQTALLLSELGPSAHIILAVRDLTRGVEVADEIGRRGGGGTAEVMHLDLSSLSSVRHFARTFILSGRVIHGLVNNAGAYGVAGSTDDGMQSTFQVNCVAPAILTEMLLPAASDDFRVVNVSSEMGRILVGSVAKNCPPPADARSGGGARDYALSKAGQVVHAHGLTRRFAAESTAGGKRQRRAFAVEPGLVRTNVLRHASDWSKWFNYTLLGPLFLRTEDEGCSSALFCLLASVEDLEETLSEKTGNLNSGATSLSIPPFAYADCKPIKLTKCYSRVEEVRALEEFFNSIECG